MKKTLLIILLLTGGFSTLIAQSIKPETVKKKVAKDDWEKNYKDEFSNCGFNSKYTPKQRLAMYPSQK